MQPQDPKPIVNSEPKNNNLTVLVMAIFILLCLSSVMFLFYQNQQLKKMILSYQTQQAQPSPINTPVATIDPTSDWKTYEDKNLSFSFKYPPTIFLKKDPTNVLVAYPESKKSDPYFEQNYSDFIVDVRFTQHDSSFQTAIKSGEEYFKSYENFSSQKLENGFLKMSGVLNGKATIRGFFNYKNKAIEITYWERDWTVSPTIFNQILSTFKFLDTENVTKKFESKKFNFSFEYPDKWFLNTYDEEKSLAGTHSLTSYDSVEIQKYMDHGMLDINKYGKSIAKIEISPSNFIFPNYFENGSSKKYVTTPKEYIDAVVYTEVNESGYDIEKPIVLYKTNFKIDNLDVSEIDFKNSGPSIFDTVKAFYIFPQNRVIRIGVYFKGINGETFENSQLKKVIDSILNTFKF